ncbi:MAG: hypothetical protein KatS3mg111_2884 [Pirellulaceae bacterium]|nr:MAG: hypothetical protein KatS3mg111_2884 [Pirellulaceae bacterium]
MTDMITSKTELCPWVGRVAWLGIGLWLIVGSGCRALRDHRQTRSLAMARQLSLRGAGLLQQQNYAEAAPLFSEALQYSVADERAHWGMAEVLWEQDQREAAIEHMEQAVGLSGQNPELLVRLGEMYRQTGNLDSAARVADEALTCDRRCHAAWSLKGDVLKERQRWNEALDCYQRALIYHPEDAAARIALADLYQRLRRPQRALATLERLVDVHPTDELPAEAWILKGQCLADLGQQLEARDCLRQAALCVDEADADLLLKLASLQLAFGELAEARVCLGRARQHVDPHDPRLQQLQRAVENQFASITDGSGTTVLSTGFQRPASPQ